MQGVCKGVQRHVRVCKGCVRGHVRARGGVQGVCEGMRGRVRVCKGCVRGA